MAEISIIIPIYNVEKYLKRCLDSIFSQTFTDWEAVCINDGSTDGSGQIADEYAKKDKRVRVIHQKNQGLSMARNNGLKHITGNYVCFLDSDDFMDRNFLSDLYNRAKTTDADMVMTSTKHIGRHKTKKDNFENKEITSFVEKIRALPHGGCWNKIYKKQFISKHKLQFPKGLYWEDNIFTIQACLLSNKLAILGGIDNSYNYVTNSVSITRNPLKAEKRQKDSITIYKMIMDFVKSKNCTNKELKAVSDFCLQAFINAKNLRQDDFYAEIKKISGETNLLKQLHIKQNKKKFIDVFKQFFIGKKYK